MDAPGILRSRQNPKVQSARRLARDPRLAGQEGVFIADGTTLVREAIEAGLPARSLFIDPDDPEAGALRAVASIRNIRPILASSTVLRAISNLATPQGAVGIFERPHCDLPHLLAATRAAGHPLIVVFHELQDPTNVGALIRTALAAGLTGAITTEQTCDPFHPRAVRAAMGACLQLPICPDQPAAPLWQVMKRGGYRLLALDPRGDVPLAGLSLDRPTVLLLGREGSGLEREARRACDASVRIPMAPGVESLGVAAAGAIVFYALALGTA